MSFTFRRECVRFYTMMTAWNQDKYNNTLANIAFNTSKVLSFIKFNKQMRFSSIFKNHLFSNITKKKKFEIYIYMYLKRP